MTSPTASNSLFAFDGGPNGTLEFAAADDAAVLRELLEGRTGQALPITLAISSDADADVEGHSQGPSVALTLYLGEDDTTGHAINVHFPTAADAARVRRNLILTGALAGSIVLGSAGAMVISSQAGAPAVPAIQVQSPVYERPAGHGMLEGVDPAPATSTAAAAAAAAAATTGASSIIDPATGRPADRGFLQGEDGAVGDAEPAFQLPFSARPTGAGPLEGDE